VFDPGSMDITPNGGVVSAVVYWPCNHRWPVRWLHRLRGNGTHLVYLDTLPAVSGNEMTFRWDAAGHLTIEDDE
jgi:hypothetical protein